MNKNSKNNISKKNVPAGVFLLGLFLLCFIIGCVFGLVYITTVSSAQTSRERTVKVGYYENEVFEEGAAEGAVKTGYAYEYYRKLSEYTGWNYEYVYGGFDEMYQKLLDGEIDLLAGLAKKEERTSIIGYPMQPMGNEEYSLVKHETDEEISADPATLSGKKIGVLESAIADVLREYLDGYGVSAEVVTFGDYESVFEAFDTGKIDILAAEGDGAYGREHAEVVCPFGAADYYLCVNIKRNDLLEELNTAQAELVAEEPGYLTTLQNKYYSSSISGHAFSSDERNWIKNNVRLTVGYLDRYLPYSATGDEGQVTGIISDIVPEMFGVMGIDSLEFTYIDYQSYDDMIKAVRSGQIDVAFPVGGGLYYAEESGIYQTSAVASATTDLVYLDEYTEETEKLFASNENNRMQSFYIQSHFPDAKIVYYPSIDDCLKAVLNGEVTATTLNGLRANDILRNSKYDDLHLRQLSKTDDRCFGVRIGNEGLLRLLNRGIKLIGTEYAQTKAYRYVGELYEYTFLDVMKEHAWLFLIIALLIIALIFFLIVRDLRRQKRASRLKTDFVSNMSHEIRTPITAILGMNELIQRECDDDEILGYSDNIDKAGKNLLGIINDILDFSKIEAGRMELVINEYSLPEMIMGLSAMTSFRAGEKGLEFSVDVDEDLPCGLIGDEQKLTQVITNLLTNAIKYTAEGSVSLEVKLVSADEGASPGPSEAAGMSDETGGRKMSCKMRVSVADTGIGIRQEEMEKLYSAFDRLDLDHTGTIEGSGLGLAISESMLELMGSHMEVESTYGEGSTFSFVIEQQINDPAVVGDFSAYESGRTSSREHRVASFTAPDARIMIVDDTPMNLQVIEGLLKNNKMQIDTAGSGSGCIDLYKNETYDVIFLDQRMPGMSGMDTLSELKRLYPEKLKNTPVVLLTANALSGARERAMREGFSDYLAKPVSLRDMEEVLLKYLPEEKVFMVSGDEAACDTGDIDPEMLAIVGRMRKISALDVEHGINYCGDEEDYIEALRTYAASVEERSAMLERHRVEGDMEALSILAHSVKSTSDAVGATGLRDMAKELEFAAKDGDTDTVNEKLPVFIDKYQEFGDEISKALVEIEQ